MTNSVTQFISENPEYIPILEKLVEYENNNPNPDSPYLDGENYDACWDHKDVNIHPSKLYTLETNGVLDRVFDTNSSTIYSLQNRKRVEDVVSELGNKFDGSTKKVEHEFPDEETLEEIGVFDDVVGYEDAKWLLRNALSSEDIVNILLVGPPGCGKTVFLRCISRLDGASFISGKKTSESGFTDEMFDKEPRFMCIDEIDDMDNDDQEALSDYTEEGRLVETKGNNKRREMITNTKTFSAANSTDDIIPQIANRFTDLHFDQYTLEEFKQVCKNILPRDYGQTEKQAVEIAEAVWEIDGFANVRKAEDVASLSRGSDPEKVVRVLDNYSPGEDMGVL